MSAKKDNCISWIAKKNICWLMCSQSCHLIKGFRSPFKKDNIEHIKRIKIKGSTDFVCFSKNVLVCLSMVHFWQGFKLTKCCLCVCVCVGRYVRTHSAAYQQQPRTQPSGTHPFHSTLTQREGICFSHNKWFHQGRKENISVKTQIILENHIHTWD